MAHDLLPAVLIDGEMYRQASDLARDGFKGPLSRLDGGDHFAICLWHYASTADIDEAALDLKDYLQAGGSGRRLTLELRETSPDGEPLQWVLGRSQPRGELSEEVSWPGFTANLYPEEVWDADQAAAIFEVYAQKRTIPSTVSRRPIDLES